MPVTEPPVLPTTIAPDLLLARLACADATPKKVRDDLNKLCERSTAEWDSLRDQLISTGELVLGKRKTITLTESGRARALRFLGVDELPAATKWSSVVNSLLLPRALDMSAAEAARLNTGDKLAAILLRRKYGLADNAGTSVKRVVEALACRELGFPEETTLEGVLCAVVGRLMGAARLSLKETNQQLPLFGTGLPNTKLDSCRRQLVRMWLNDQQERPAPTVEGIECLSVPEVPEPWDLPTFAATVRALAESSPPDARFHGNKVFISALWRASQQEPGFPRLGLEDFKQQLVAANSHGLLQLSRADLVQAMDPAVVAESETRYLNASFHFVLVEGVA